MSTATTTSGLPSCLAKLETLSHSAVFDALQKEFSPLIDSTLVAALLADIDFPLVAPTPSSPSSSYATTAASAAVGLQSSSKPAVSSQTSTTKKTGKKGGKKGSKNSTQTQTSGRRVSHEASPANAHTPPTSFNGVSAETTPLLETSLFVLYETLKALADQAESEAGLGVEADTNAQHEAGVGVEAERDVSAGANSIGARRQSTSSSKKNGPKNKKRNGWNKTSITGTTTGPSSESTGIDLETGSSCTGNTTISTSRPTSNSSPSDCASPISPSFEFDVPEDVLSFLQAALPQIPTRTLKSALGKRLLVEQRSMPSWPLAPSTEDGDGTSNLDMWAIISGLITSEDTREMDERGMALSSSGSNFSSPSELIEDDEEDEEEDEERRYQAQLEEDERLARELAAQFEEEDKPKAYRKGQNGRDGDEWAVTSKKKKQQKAGNKSKATATTTNGRMTIKLNDVRQQQTSTSRQPQSPLGTTSTGAIPEPSTSSAYREGLAALLPSLATYLSSILKDRSPSALLSGVNKNTKAGGKKASGEADSSTTYIQNVFLNEKAVTSKYEGKVYLAVKACLERVVEVLGVQAEEEAARRREREERARQKEKEKEREAEKRKDEEGGKNKGGEQAKRGSKKFPPEDSPRSLPQNAKNRARTVTDRDLEREKEPGGSEEGSSNSGSTNDNGSASSTGQGDDAEVEDDTKTERELDEENTLLFTLLDILLLEYALTTGAQQQYIEVHQLLSDIELCIAVTSSPSRRPISREGYGDGEGGSEAEDALNLAELLCGLYVSDADPEKEVGRVMEMFADGLEGGGGTSGGRAWRREGVSYAAKAGMKVRQRAWGAAALSVNNESDRPFWQGIGSTDVQGRAALGTAETDAVQKKPNKPSPYQWQAIPVKKAPAPQPYTIHQHLPTYTRDVNGIKVRDAESESNTVWVQGMQVPGWDPSLSTGNGRRRTKASEYEAAEREYRHSIKENMRRRDELLREAARMYNRGSVGSGDFMGRKGKGRGTGKVRGGDVAWYFAERAREFQEAAKKQSFNAARAMVLRKQGLSGDQDTVDLHGTTVNEAVEIVLEILESRGRGKPLKIVTGRGLHSANGTSVLKPAVKKRLVEEGWSVSAWDAGLVVR
ncbi:hypothetical protein EST38_g4483 [Candolleomyces aberdarensis]|uniref:Smr domain-containing protein n=1 Tax=Candolleomyces aberdarensis TaxID=2316362 RepID=A0A4Q2DN12_9AGAR|nr:hypothetical protein EST38_g4483 [Candolleomyces aberdarensis]